MSAGAQSHRQYRTIWSVQYLRAVAAVLVVYAHAHDQLQSAKITHDFAGVDLFFVISGFIMVSITHMRPAGPDEFILRRIARIVPIYWLFTTLTAAAILIAPGLFRQSHFSFSHYVLSLLMIPHHSPDVSAPVPLLKLGWTLNYEMFFYVIFASTLFLAATHRIFVLAAIFMSFVLSGWLIKFDAPALVFYTNPIILEFLMGALVGYGFASGKFIHIDRHIAWASILVGAFTALMLSSWEGVVNRVIIYGLPFSLLLWGSVALEADGGVAKLPVLGLTGDSSYSLYLSHLYPVILVRYLWQKGGLGMQGFWWGMAFVTVAIVLAVAVGIVSYSLLEQPLNRAGHRWIVKWINRGKTPALKRGGL